MYENLIPEFLQAMEEIGKYGREKYGLESFQLRQQRGDRTRFDDRVKDYTIRQHAVQHFMDYERRMVHDKFGTLRHQLAAVAFNAMMEFYYARLDEERTPAK